LVLFIVGLFVEALVSDGEGLFEFALFVEVFAGLEIVCCIGDGSVGFLLGVSWDFVTGFDFGFFWFLVVDGGILTYVSCGCCTGFF
jgi:hypothetical protein